MANLPDSLYEDYSTSKLTLPSASSFAPTTTVVPFPDMDTIIQWINDLHNEIPFVSNSALQNLVTESCDLSRHKKCQVVDPFFLAREGLWRYPPVMLLNGTFASLLAEDPDAVNYRKQLIRNMQSKAMK
ncbi:hypothetical protein F2Q70_00025271 [Brassica cretica]|uniref:Uncharacterized protein n=1 Tax=Brassica cretica TaxID=69181 RepID=A0A8S9LES3_BRACR|nr:hypothetical protein F2Q70_00025271 [Brassica cretica]